MARQTQDFDPEQWQILVGTWSIDASHAMLGGDEIRGEMTFEWLDGHRLLVQRSHYGHPAIPDALAVFGVIDDQLSVHYYDARGVHRTFMLSFVDRTLRYARNAAAPDFSQRVTLTVSGDANLITGQSELSRDGSTWEKDLAIVYQRVR